jgi:hypothetical protein
MSAYPWEKGILVIAIDPAQIRSAVAMSGISAEGRRRTALMSASHITKVRALEPRIREFASACEFDRVSIAVEYPSWGGHGTAVVRAAANAYLEFMRDIFTGPRVQKVGPQEWQAMYDYRKRPSTQTTKEFSYWLALAYGWSPKTHDEADAALILEFARAQGAEWLLRA